jgi:hypothetical protein
MKFLHLSLVRHVNTGGIYRVIGLPAEGYVIEATHEPAYLYRAVVKGVGDRWILDVTKPTVWVRSAQEMEDGRFEQAG